MGRIELSLACGDYDRTRAILDGRVRPEGISLYCNVLGWEEMFWRMLKYREFHVSEMSASAYLIQRVAWGDDGMIAIPVFLSRTFRHNAIYINVKSGIREPGDLRGRKVGCPEYHMTALLWARGLLQHEYGVRPDEIIWMTGGLEQPGRRERVQLNLPDRIEVVPIPHDRTLSAMLAEGVIDALITPHVPSCYARGSGLVRRLFEDYRAEEMTYFKKTGIFPIMHLVVIRRDLYDRHPWVARSLYNAFCEAKRIAIERLNVTGAACVTLPWLAAELEDSIRVLGDDFWPYGLKGNEATLEAMVQYSFEQGMIPTKPPIEELFATNTLEEIKV